MKPVTDPALLAQLNGPVTDPALLAQLNAPETPAGQIPVDPRLKAPAAQANPNFGERLYNAVRQPQLPLSKRLVDLARPTVEALGSVAGGVAGTALGPLGTVAGGGLGYGAAKTGMDILEQTMGTQRAPSSAGEALTRGATDVLTGATMDAAGRVAAPMLAGAAGKVMDIGNLSALRASRLLKDALNRDAPGRGVSDAVNALRASAGKDMSAGQALSDLNSPTAQALLDSASRRNPAVRDALAARQNAESVNALARAAGGETETAVRETTRQAQRNLNTITQPMKGEALSRANLGKSVAADTAVREANDLAVMVGSGGKINPERFAAQAVGAEKALRSSGVKPLEVEPLARRISAIPKNPAFAENDLIEGSATAVADALRKWSGSGGVIDAVALDAIRKNAVDATIAKLRPNMDATAQRNAAAGVLSEIKPFIDDAIEQAGGKGYKEYLTRHAEGMQKIAEKKLVGEALRLWNTNKDQFVKLVNNGNPDLVEEVLGPGKFNIAKDLADSHVKVLQEQAIKALRDKNVSSQVTSGQEALKNLLIEDIPLWRFPNQLNPFVAVANRSLKEIEEKLGKETMKTLAKASESPEAAGKLLATLPAAERVRILNILRNPQSWSTTQAGVARGVSTQAIPSDSQDY